MTAAAEPHIACIGEAMIELSFAGDAPDLARVGFAGDTLNTAIYLKRALGTGGTVDYVTALGADPFSARMTAMIDAEGVGTARIATVPDRLPGLYAIQTDERGERTFSYWRENSAARLLFAETGAPDFSRLAGFQVLYFSAITLAILRPDVRSAFLDWLPRYRAAGGKAAFDSNYRPRLWPDQATARAAVAKAWSQTDIALPSVDDEMALFGDKDEGAVLARIRASGCTEGALKRGAAGPLAINPYVAPATYAPAARVVDTTAAGDSFNGAFLAAHLTGVSPEYAMQAGHALASKVIGHKGAIVPAKVLG